MLCCAMLCRYLIFPDLGECCSCCSAESGCGILDPNWLKGAEYVGQVRGTVTQAGDDWSPTDIVCQTLTGSWLHVGLPHHVI